MDISSYNSNASDTSHPISVSYTIFICIIWSTALLSALKASDLCSKARNGRVRHLSRLLWLDPVLRGCSSRIHFTLIEINTVSLETYINVFNISLESLVRTAPFQFWFFVMFEKTLCLSQGLGHSTSNLCFLLLLLAQWLMAATRLLYAPISMHFTVCSFTWQNFATIIYENR